MATTTASAHQASSSSNKKNQTESISQTVFSINHQPLISTIKADTIMYIFLNHKQTLLLNKPPIGLKSITKTSYFFSQIAQ